MVRHRNSPSFIKDYFHLSNTIKFELVLRARQKSRRTEYLGRLLKARKKRSRSEKRIGGGTMQKHIVALDVSAIRVNTFRFTQTRSLFGHRGRFISRVYFRWESSRRTSFEIHEQRFFSIETARAQKLRDSYADCKALATFVINTPSSFSALLLLSSIPSLSLSLHHFSPLLRDSFSFFQWIFLSFLRNLTDYEKKENDDNRDAEREIKGESSAEQRAR